MFMQAFIAPLLAGALQQQPADFWVSERADPRLWREVRTAFREELQPDDPAKTAPYVAMKYKVVARIARVSDVSLVVIRQREKASDLPDFDSFVAFSYDAVSHRKVRIGNDVFSPWKSVKWVSFAPETPEVVFTHQTCTECEADYLLSSVFFDAASRTWTLRNWAEDGESIHVGSDWTVGAEINSRSDCLYRIADFSNDGNVDVAVWCRETFDEPSRKPQESVSLYTVSAGRAIKRAPDAVHARSLKRAICRGQASHALCRSRP